MAASEEQLSREPLMRSILRRKVLVLLLLTAVLPASQAGAARRPAAAASSSSQTLFSRIAALLKSIWAKEGCHIDPNGLCGVPGPANQVEEGCNIDPNGRCRS